MNATLRKALIFSGATLGAVIAAVVIVVIILRTGSRAANARLDNPPVSSALAGSEPQAPVDNGIRLVISSPENDTLNVTAPEFTFSGTSDPAEPLTVNGTAVERGEDGAFTYNVTLNVGKNTFAFEPSSS